MSENGVYQFSATRIDGTEESLEKYAGKVLLIVNTASKCGFTPQYQGLQKLYEAYHDKGLEILGFPCNQFGGQEPGSNEEVAQFCSTNYGVTFPMFAKIEVNGSDTHPLYTYLKSNTDPSGSDIPWNFTKFLVDKHGNVTARFEPGVTPAELGPKIDELLAAE